MKHSHYFKPVAGLEHIDVYRTLLLFGVTDPCLQHAIKKLLVAGGRGAKDISQDVQEAIDTLERWKTMRQEEEQPARHPMTPNVISYPAVEVGSDVDFDGARVNRVANSHGDGEHYAELAIQQGGKPIDPPSFDWAEAPGWARLVLRHVEHGVLFWCDRFAVGGWVQQLGENQCRSNLTAWGVYRQDGQPARFEIIAERST